MPELTIVQRRIGYALNCVNQLEADGNYGKYASYVKAFPASILMNTLGQALATLRAKAKGDATDPHLLLYTHIQDWLCGANLEMPYSGATDLLAALTSNGEVSYLHAQTEALELLVWLKKFAGTFLEEGGNP